MRDYSKIQLSERINASIREGAKYCARCEIYKPHAEFTPWKTSRDGRHNYCIPCRAKYNYQLLLKKEFNKGNRAVAECDKCDYFFKITLDHRTLCRECR